MPDDLVRNIAPQIEVIKIAFPDVKFGDIESVNNLTFGRMNENLQFAKQFFQQTGARLSFMHADTGMTNGSHNWRNGEDGCMRRGCRTE